ncbi:MAG: hypothetical protein HAW63_02685 [Bdellovibrionaceae bacterium]|nr:hypothetical protein [Pseudobdellovibrionaceae bacterium]
MFKIIIYLSIFFTLTSCTNAIEFSNDSVDFSRPSNLILENITHIQKLQYESSNKQVDILLVVDNSKSMADEHAKMIQKFKNNFIPYLRDLDWRMGVLTTDSREVFSGGWFSDDIPSPSGFGGKLLQLNAQGDVYFHKNTPNFIDLFHKTIQRIGCNTPEQQASFKEESTVPLSEEDQAFCLERNGNEQPFNSIVKSINYKESHNSSFFRDRAHLITIIISDEDEDDISELQAADLIQAAKIQWPRKVLRSYSISVLPKDQACKDASSKDYDAHFGVKLFHLSQLTQGVSLSICQENYAPLFKTISTSIYNSFLLKIYLEKKPVSGSLQLILDPSPTYSFHYTVKNQTVIFKEPLSFDTTFIIKYLTPNVNKQGL